MTGERRELAIKLRVGFFVLVAVAAFLGMVYALGARARLFEPRYTIHADFTEVGGLTEGATVRLAGVQIGRVTGVHLPSQPGGKVRVDLTIARRFGDRIRKNSVARIETQGLLGDKIVEITVGTERAPPVGEGEAIAARDPFNIGDVVDETSQIVKSVGTLAEALRRTAETLNQGTLLADAGAAVASARRLTEQIGRVVDRVEKGPGLAHALLYEEPVALRRVNELLASTQTLLARIERGEGAAGVLTSAESTAAAKRFVAAMDRLGQVVARQPDEEGVLPALLFDPKYKALLEDLRVVAGNLRDVSDRVAGGRGTLGSLVKDEATDVRGIARDLQEAVANLKEITAKINEGEGTLGALIADPSIYERLVRVLEGAQRSFLLRNLIRGLGRDGGQGKDDGARK
jgi:phospholipid/cholesterol/gamma-HCH transport system substrate-binding protein